MRMPGAAGGAGGTVEADTTINALIIRADGETVERIRGYVEELEAQYAAQTPETRYYTLKFADPRDVSAALSTLFGTAGGARGPRFQGAAVGGGGQVKAVVAGNQVVVEAPLEKFPQIEEVISQLDDVRGRDIIVKTIKMPGADVSGHAQRLNSAFREMSRNRNLVARFDADVSTETILLTVSSELLPEAERLLDEIRDVSEKLVIDTQFRQLMHATAQEAAAWLQQQLITSTLGTLGRNASQQIRVTPDSRTNRLIVSGPQVAVKQGMQLLDQFDIPVPVHDEPIATPIATDTRKLPGLDVGSLANQLNQIFRARPPRPDKLQYSFAADVATSTLIFTVPKDGVAEVEAIISKFAAETTDLEQVQEFFEIKNADAAYVAQQVQNLLNVRLTATRGRDVAQRVNVTVDQRLNRVIMYAPKFAIELGQALIAELDQVAPTADLIQTISLKNADGNTVVGVLNTALAELFRTKRALRVAVEPLTNSLIVAGASKEEFAQISKFASDLDEGSSQFDRVPVMIELKHADPGQMVNMINGLYGGGRRSGTSQQQQVMVTSTNNMLVIQAPPRKVDEIKQLIAQIDAVDASGIEVKTYQLKLLSAQQVAMQVQFYLASLGNLAKPGQLRPGAFAEPTTNTLVVLAPREQISFIDLLITKLEASEVPSADTQTYVLRHARADAIANNVAQMLQAKVAEREGVSKQQSVRTLVFADPTGNRLFVYAPSQYQELAGEMIRMIDTEVDSGDIVRVVSVEKSDAAAVANTLNQIIQSRSGGAQGARRVSVVADAASNNVLLSGLPKDVAWAQGLVDELAANGGSTPELRIFKLEHLSTMDAADILNGVMAPAAKAGETVTITEDSFYNRLIVSAPRRKMREIESYLKLVDVRPGGEDAGLLAGGKNIYFVPIVRGDAFDICYDVEDLLPPASRGGPDLTPDWDGDYIKVICRESEIDQIRELIRKFDDNAKEVRKIVVRRTRDWERVAPYLSQKLPNLRVEQLGGEDAASQSIIMTLPPPTSRPDLERKERREHRNGSRDGADRGSREDAD
ncbi:MAG: hypothetical protein HUU27_10750, partial [Phycisphaerae bacterium]|nr:hypothetical protein [Phycisphaerae bacterium]